MSTRLDLPDTTWRRVSPKYVVARLIDDTALWVVVVAIGIVLTVIGVEWGLWVAITGGVVGLAFVAFVPRRVRAIGYQLRDDDLIFRRGIMFLRVVSVPYGRMQLVDINRGPLLRMLGLSELKFVTAAASTGLTIPGLAQADADELRDRLVALAESRRAGL